MKFLSSLALLSLIGVMVHGAPAAEGPGNPAIPRPGNPTTPRSGNSNATPPPSAEVEHTAAEGGTVGNTIGKGIFGGLGSIGGTIGRVVGDGFGGGIGSGIGGVIGSGASTLDGGRGGDGGLASKAP